MIVLRATPPRFACLQVLDLPVDAVNATLDTLVAHAERDVQRRSGFEGARWLLRSAGPPAGHGPDARLLEYTLWSSRTDLEAYTAAVPLPAEVGEVVKQQRVNTYRLDAVITGRDTDHMTMEPGDPRLTLVVMMEPAAGQQSEISRINENDTRDFFATYDGFAGTAFHLADRGDEFVEYIQWESMAAYQAAAADPRFGEHLEALGRLCVSEVGIYEVKKAVDAVGPGA